jgi:hypothetical protein
MTKLYFLETRLYLISQAKLLLRADVAEKKHETMTPSKLQGTHAEYKPFKARSFKQCIYQEVRCAKFISLLVHNCNTGHTASTDEDSEDDS